MKPPALRQPPAGWSCSKRRLSTRTRQIPAATLAMWASWPIPSAPKASDRTCWSCPRRRDGSRWSSAIGHRRLAAAKLAGLERVPAVVAELDEREQRELMLVENSQRTDLTVVEEADGYQGLLDLGSSVEEAARKTGRSVSLVRRRLKVAAIDDDVRSHVGAAQLSIEDWETIADYEAWPDL